MPQRRFPSFLRQLCLSFCFEMTTWPTEVTSRVLHGIMEGQPMKAPDWSSGTYSVWLDLAPIVMQPQSV